MEQYGIWVAIAIAFVGGNGSAKLLDLFNDWRKGVAEKRRAEVDRIAEQLSASRAEKELLRTQLRDTETRERDLHRRERMILEHVSLLRRMLYDRGVTMNEMPPFSLSDDRERQ